MLERFDEVMAKKIAEGYYCELIAVNPQIRSAVKKFGLAISERHRRQTDRQTLEILVPTTVITDDADEDEGTQVAERILEGEHQEHAGSPRRQEDAPSDEASDSDDREAGGSR